MQKIQFDYFYRDGSGTITASIVSLKVLFTEPCFKNSFLRSKGIIRSDAGPYEPEH